MFGEHPAGVVLVEAAHVLVPRGAHGALRLVGGVERHLGEHLVAHLVDVTADQREQRRALEPRRLVDAGDVADRRVQVEVAHQRVVDPPTGEAPGPPHDEHHADATVVHRRLRVREREAVVGREDHQRVVDDAVLVERVQHRADALVERPGAGLERGHVAPGLGRVDDVARAAASRGRRGPRSARSTRGGSRRTRPRGRTARSRAGPLGDEAGRRRRDVAHPVALELDDVVVADVVRVAPTRAARRRGPTSSRRRAARGRGGARDGSAGSPGARARASRWRGWTGPVSSAAREPEHTGAAQKAWRNSTP